jgi:threonine dehydrogenase-like Zn-dependent dehydrogenase
MLRVVPESLSLRVAALIEPASVAWHAVSRAGEVAGKRVLVVGAGPMGALVIAVLKHRGAAEIVAVDMFDGPLEIARSVGASHAIVATDADAIAAVDADIVVECSGDYRGLASGLRGATRGGRVVMLGLLPSGEQPALISLAITRELELVGSFRFNDEIDHVIAALADGNLDAGGVITHEFAVEDALEAFAVARDSASSGKVLLAW